MAQFDIPDIVEDSVNLVYSQYTSRYELREGDTPDPRVQNNVPEFLRYNLFTTRPGQTGPNGLYGPNNIVDDAYKFLIDAFNIDEAAGTDLDNIGDILGQPRPAQQQACFMSFEFQAPFDPVSSGTPWGGFPDTDTPPITPNCPWFFQNDPENTGGSVSDLVYRRALHCVAIKYFSDIMFDGSVFHGWRCSSLTTMVETLFVLLKVNGRDDFTRTSITLEQDTNDPLQWNVGFNNIDVVTMADITLLNFINPDRSRIWSKMAGVIVNFPMDFLPPV